ncbi:FSDH-like protein [Mya arenaria]|uniref:L-serine ammonia-lyase n=1 Tax=Mya arenaria TaxID=6604 RepID=A0ABY7FU23_MYAAR|nr:FSDH-like protein [Mya arenaria]
MANNLTLADITSAAEVLKESPDVVRTPLLRQVQGMWPTIDQTTDLYLKLENMQTTGSFKIRGVTNQMEHLPSEVKDGSTCAVTFSAGNYGKAFAHCMSRKGLKGLVLLPHTAPEDRVKMIQSYGLEALKVPSSEIEDHVADHVAKGYILLHSFDDIHLVQGYGSIALEILAEVPDPDIVVVCCGGAGLVAGVAAGIRLAGCDKCPPTLFESFKAGYAVKIPSVKSVATGLMPPSTGKVPYMLCQKYLEDVLLVTDDELLMGMRHLYDRGLKVEPAGAAAFTALLQARIPDTSGKKVVIVVTGGNITPPELAKLIG